MKKHYFVAVFACLWVPSILWSAGSYETGAYRNLLAEHGKTTAEIDKKITEAWGAIFEGTGDPSEHKYREAEDGMSYVLGWHKDYVFSKTMSNALIATVQMDRRDIFDRLWKWLHTKMYQTSGNWEGYFVNKVDRTADRYSESQAPFGNADIRICMALIFASGRWGDGDGIFDYTSQAEKLLSHWVDNAGTAVANGYYLFRKDKKVPLYQNKHGEMRIMPAALFPHYFELFAVWSTNGDVKPFFDAAADSARYYLKRAAHPETGLIPYKLGVSGEQLGKDDPHHSYFHPESHDAILNIALDYAWFEADRWQVTFAGNLMGFFAKDGFENWLSRYFLNGKKHWTDPDSKAPLHLRASTTALGLFATDKQLTTRYVQDLWDLPVFGGDASNAGRSLRYLIGLLHLAGQYRLYGFGQRVSVSQQHSAGLQLGPDRKSELKSETYDLRGRSVSGNRVFWKPAPGIYLVERKNGPTRLSLFPGRR